MPPACDIRTGAVMDIAVVVSFWGLAMTPMYFASRMNDPPWSPSNIPFFVAYDVSATTAGAYRLIS